jgi:hypothetical protein
MTEVSRRANGYCKCGWLTPGTARASAPSRSTLRCLWDGHAATRNSAPASGLALETFEKKGDE